MSDPTSPWAAGARAVAPILVGIVPFGLIAGAAPGAAGLGKGFAIAYSPIVFAGAAQLAMVDLLEAGGSVAVVVSTALVINLRMLMYGASLAPSFADVPMRRRLWSSYLLTDQAYAVTISRYGTGGTAGAGVDGAAPPHWRERISFYLGAASLMWVTWQITTLIGVAVGEQIPPRVPLAFVIPLMFLALLLPTIRDRPSLVAASVGGVGAVVYGELGAGNLSLLAGALTGVAAGAASAWWDERDFGPVEGLEAGGE